MQKSTILYLRKHFMVIQEFSGLIVEQRAVASRLLNRYVIVDIYLPRNLLTSKPALLLLNDGQNLSEIHFSSLLANAFRSHAMETVVCVGVYANTERSQEYGTANQPDYEGRGSRSALYQQFILDELLPFLYDGYGWQPGSEKSVCGFSLGGLSALDMAWNHPDVFSKVGVFSGSLWWRSQPLGKGYDDEQHRIMHQKVRSSRYKPNLKFFFTTGSLDETADRNHNGIIDSIDDTLDLIKELKQKGYSNGEVTYINYPDGRHDVESWGLAMPDFLEWGWGGGGRKL